MIAWSECFATHIETIDSQHKKLFELLNKLSDNFNKNGPSEDSIDEVLKKLIHYAHEHFIEEELLMLHSKVGGKTFEYSSYGTQVVYL
jgi:hemerythrin-like metal-binding protein